MHWAGESRVGRPSRARRARILFVASSQGTAAGLDGADLWSNYPLLVQEALPEADCTFWTMSDLSVSVVDNLFREVVMQHRPDVVILQCGIIEAALRILPAPAREVLRHAPGGRRLTKLLHDHRREWTGLLNRLSVRFVDVEPLRYRQHVASIHEKCQRFGFELVVVRLPLLSEQCEREMLPGNNRVIEEYGAALTELCSEKGIAIVDPFEGNADPTRNSLYLSDSVHFTVAGHRLIAANLDRWLRRSLLADLRALAPARREAA